MKRLNILLIGSANSFANRLIRQFNKEGHRVSLLTGSPRGNQKYPRVFERYDFSYTSEVLPEVFGSVSPDVTIFTGAYDGHFDWDDERSGSVAYISAVMNILSAYSSYGKGRFVYLSSESVFKADDELLYSEEDEIGAFDLRSTALVQAEEICRQFMTDLSTDIIIVRVGGYYHFPKVPEEIDDFISEFCACYLKNGTVDLPDDRMIMPLSESDAVFFLIRIALAQSHGSSVYNLASGNRLSVRQLKEMIDDAAKAYGYKIPKGDRAEAAKAEGRGLSARIKRYLQRKADSALEEDPSKTTVKAFFHLRQPQAMLNASRFKDEFGINRITEFSKELEQTVGHMLKNREAFLGIDSGNQSLFSVLKKEFIWLLHIFLPYVENVLCFIAFFLLSNSTSGSKYFGRIDFYLIYVLLFAILYGQYQAIVSAFLATGGFLYVQLIAGSDHSALLDFNTYVWIAQLFILGLAVGYLKDRLSDQKAEALNDYEHMTQQIDDVKEINESNVRVKDALHTEIVNQNDSIGKIYDITSTLDRYDSEDVFFHAMDVLRQIMGSDDIALYTVSNSAYARLFSATTELAGSLGNSIKYRELGELYENIKDGKPYINRRLTEGMPMMACAIRENDEIRTIIMIWKLPWEKMTLGQASILTVTSMLIQNAVLRAHRFLDVIHSERFIDDTRILKPEAFSSLLGAYRNAEKNRLTRFTLLRITSDNENDSAIDVGRLASARLRQDDHLGMGADGNMYILLPNTNVKSAQIVIDRLKEYSVNAVPVKNIKTGEGL